VRRKSDQGMDLTVHLHLVSKFRISGAISLLSLYALVTSAAKTLTFTIWKDKVIHVYGTLQLHAWRKRTLNPMQVVIFLSAKKNKFH
jgi:hypothetical protein